MVVGWWLYTVGALVRSNHPEAEAHTDMGCLGGCRRLRSLVREKVPVEVVLCVAAVALAVMAATDYRPFANETREFWHGGSSTVLLMVMLMMVMLMKVMVREDERG